MDDTNTTPAAEEQVAAPAEETAAAAEPTETPSTEAAA